ncbi:hypothetical protein RHMOL_Rhmol03G0135300 [Rhododendron molle]|uniref:Uncharacterized protein n=1 Tax=Rhododendron molle TaxID=49168 RepID=A0ACC0PF77_RHOML|nr:hypothetical protein RHMOL_Rhmol03G0135300 [Rhododendron molle]
MWSTPRRIVVGRVVVRRRRRERESTRFAGYERERISARRRVVGTLPVACENLISHCYLDGRVRNHTPFFSFLTNKGEHTPFFSFLTPPSKESRSPVPMKSGQGPVPVLRTVDLANQRLRSAEHFLIQNDVVLVGAKSVRLISTSTACPDFTRTGDPGCHPKGLLRPPSPSLPLSTTPPHPPHLSLYRSPHPTSLSLSHSPQHL